MSKKEPVVLTPAQKRLWDHWSKHPWNYIAGDDEDGRPIIWTVDERDNENPVKPFPKDKKFLKKVVDELWDGGRIVFVEKSRQMYISTISMLIVDWFCTFHSDREVVVSRVKESSAVKLINDKIRRVHRNKPQWLQDYVDMSVRPAAVITYGCSLSTITAVAQNFALTDSRGITASLVVVDEAAYQDYFPQIYQAVLPMSNKLWAVTTPHIGNAGALLFRQLAEEGKKDGDAESQRIHTEKGFRARTTPRGIRVLTLHWSADPDRDDAWKQREKKYYATEKDWRRENELDWTSAEGDVFYPEFGEIGRDRFVAQATKLISGPVYRGFDFGFRRPACVWFQYAAGSDRVWVLREFMPHELGTHDFRDCVLYLSGQLDRSSLTERSLAWIDVYETKEEGRRGPWFPIGTDFFDIGGPEAYRTEASAIRATEESNAAAVLANGGIVLNMVDPPVKSRCDVVRRLLRVRGDGWPGIVFDPQCEELLQAFGGALAFEPVTKLRPIPTNPRKDGHFENLHDALGYGVVAVVPLDDTGVNEEGQVLLGYEGRDPVYSAGGSGFNVYEGRQ